MARGLRGHAARSILRFAGTTGLMIAGFILYNYFFAQAVVTLKLLVVMMELWVAVRGFAGLWLGLSITSPDALDRGMPVGAGLLGLGAGFAALLFFSPEAPTPFVRLLSLYGLVALLVQSLAAFRLRRRAPAPCPA